MSEEISAHVDELTARNIRAGMPAAEARNAALRVFGGVEQIKSLSRQEHGAPWLEDLMRDWRYSLRQLRKSRLFACFAVGILAIGIGASTAMFSIVNGIFLQPLDFPNPQELVAIQETYPPGRALGPVTWGDYSDWKESAPCFSSIAAAHFGAGNLTLDGESQRLTFLRVTPNYFTTLDIQPALGRLFRPDEAAPGSDNVMVVTHWFWVNRLGAREDIVNKPMQVDDRVVTLIGVLPKNSELDQGEPAYFPLGRNQFHGDPYAPTYDGANDVIARLRPGISLQAATVAMHAVTDTAKGVSKGRGAEITSLLDQVVRQGALGFGNVKTLLFLLFGAVVFFLLIACVNIANLLLVRANARQKEFGFKLALGASHGRIFRQLISESVMLSIAGGSLGVVLAYGILAAARPFIQSLPRADSVSLDGYALGFCLTAVLATGFGFGFAPAWLAMRASSIGATRQRGSRGRWRDSHTWRSTLIVVEIAMALIFLTAAGLLTRSFVNLQRVQLGFLPSGVYATSIQLTKFPSSGQQQRSIFFKQTLERLNGLLYIDSSAFTTGMPIFGTFGIGFEVQGMTSDAKKNARGGQSAITANYFRTLGIPLTLGRNFTEQDAANTTQVAIVSQHLVDHFFEGKNPLGQRIHLVNEPGVWREVVGVVGDVNQWGPASSSIAAQPGNLYVPLDQTVSLRGILFLVVHSKMVKSNPVKSVASIVRSVDPGLGLSSMYSMDEGVAQSIAKYRLSFAVFFGFSIIALMLACIGIFAVMSQAIQQRTHEIGVRVALGGSNRKIFSLIFTYASAHIGLGIAVGITGSILASGLLRSVLFGTTARDPFTFLSVVFLLTAAAFAACWVPVRRALNVSPMLVLREE